MKYKPFHPLLFAMHPVLFLYSQNTEQFPPGVMLAPILISCGITTIAMLLLWLFTSNRHRSFCILSMSLVLLFSYGHVYSFLENSGISANPKTALFLYVVLFALTVILSFVKIKDWRRSTAFLNITGAALIVLAAGGARFSLERSTGPMREASTVNMAKESAPDIFFLILDGYPREDILKKVHGFDNSLFLETLQQNGFRVLNRSHSNYSGTSLSLTATLNMAYVQDIVPQKEIRSGNQWYLKQSMEQNRVMDFLKKQGYATATFDSGYFQTEIKTVDHFYASGWLRNEFHEAVLDTTPAWVLFKNVGRYEAQRRRILYILDQLPAIRDPSRPVFVFAHVMALHPPFVFGPNGEKQEANRSSLQFWKHFGEPTKKELMTQYQQQLTFINKKVAETVKKILGTRHRPVCIVIQGDHGSSFEPPQPERDYYRERFSILNAIRLPVQAPQGNALHDSISSVNTFRVVFNLLFHAGLPLLEDRSYYSIRSEPYRWTDVTHLVRE